ncbi:MAG TPA: hypothetical protein VGW11_02525 [Solirubrobacteraceae bacterium]|nr:hypothetical protein [Solirubrobacteraceae bacterium]
MSPEETPDDRDAGILATLLTPLRLPERALEALESLAQAGRHLGPMRSELTRVRQQTEPLGDLMPAVERLVEQTEPLRDLMPLVESLVEQTKPVRDLLTVVERIREQAEPLAELLPALERLEKSITTRLDSLQEVVVRLEGSDSHLNEAVRELHREVASMHSTLTGLQDDVQSVTDRLPDPTRGPLEKARDALTGSGDQKEG